MRTALFCLIASGALLLSSCAKPTNNDNNNDVINKTYDGGFTITGGMFNNTKIDFKTITSSGGYYSTGAKATTINMLANNGDSINVNLTVTTEGNQAGNWTILAKQEDFVYMVITRTGSGVGADLSANAGGSIRIARYDGVGGKIEGTFSGSFVSGSDAYTVTDGHFNVTRVADKP